MLLKPFRLTALRELLLYAVANCGASDNQVEIGGS
jgi:hypothetical protein